MLLIPHTTYTSANSTIRYRPKNLLVPALTPGPKEPTAEQLQQYNRLIVDDLIQLYEDGINLPTQRYPNGISLTIVG